MDYEKAQKPKLQLSFLKDAPVLKSEGDYYDFYHDYISPALHEITTNQKGIHTVGLFGQWGSGKSTIIKNLEEDYSDYPLFLFDTWKYQGDPLRRTFLIQFRQFAQDKELWKEGKALDESWLDDLYVDSTTKETQKKEGTPKEKNILKITERV